MIRSRSMSDASAGRSAGARRIRTESLSSRGARSAPWRSSLLDCFVVSLRETPRNDHGWEFPLIRTMELATFYEQLVALEREGTAFVLVVLAEALGSTPQDAGAKMLVTAAGLHTGTVG